MITVAQVAAQMGRDKEGLEFTDEETGAVTQLIASVEARAEAFCDRKFTAGTLTELLTSYETPFLALTGYPAAVITSVKDKHYSDDYTIDSNNYTVQDSQVLLKFNRKWGPGYNRYEVIYTYGWTAETVPEDFKLAVIMEVISAFHIMRAEPRPTENISGFDRSVKLSERFEDYLMQYRAVV